MDRTRLTLLSLVLALALFLALNLFTSIGLRGLRTDLTEGGLYTLSDGTRSTLSKLEEPVDVTLYWTETLTSEENPLLHTYARRVRELLEEYEFPADDIPVIRGSALLALEGDTSPIGKPAILELMQNVDDYIPTPERDIDKTFLMPVEDVFSIEGRGTVATGRMERGVVKTGEEIEIIGFEGEPRKVVCTGVEMFRKILDEGRAGDNVGCLLRGIKRDEIQRGQVLAKPGSITPHTKFEAEIYCLGKDEGGRHTPFFSGYRPQFYFRTTDVTGTANLIDAEMCMPGDNVKISVELHKPIAIDDGVRFAIREGGRTVGSGVVTKIVE